MSDFEFKQGYVDASGVLEYLTTLKQVGNSNQNDGTTWSARIIDLSNMTKLWNFFTEEEELFKTAKLMRNELVFQGGINLSWGKGLLPLPTNNISNSEEQKIIDKLLKADDYRNCFGMCPIHRFQNKETGMMDFEIPAFGTGCFVLLVYTKNISRNSKIKYIPFKNANLFSGGPINSQSMKFSKNYEVYVWPNEGPNEHNTHFTTSIAALYARKVNRIDRMWTNHLTADDKNTNQPIILKKPAQQVNIDDLDEEVLLGEVSVSEVAPKDSDYYKRNVRDRIMTEQKLDEFNGRNTGRINGYNSVYDIKTNKTKITQKANILDEDNVFNLDDGQSIDHTSQLKSSDKLLDAEKGYEEAVLRSMGMTKEVLSGGSTRLKESAQQSRKLLQTHVNSVRRALSNFFRAAWDFTYRDQENEMIADFVVRFESKQEELQNLKKIHNFDEKNGLVSTAQPNANSIDFDKDFKQLDFNIKMLRSIGHEEFRVNLEFPENPFASDITREDITFAMTQNVLTPEEEVNLTRSKLDLPKLPSDHPLITERSEMKKLLKDHDTQFYKGQIRSFKDGTQNSSSIPKSAPKQSPSSSESPSKKQKTKE